MSFDSRKSSTRSTICSWNSPASCSTNGCTPQSRFIRRATQLDGVSAMIGTFGRNFDISRAAKPVCVKTTRYFASSCSAA